MLIIMIVNINSYLYYLYCNDISNDISIDISIDNYIDIYIDIL